MTQGLLVLCGPTVCAGSWLRVSVMAACAEVPTSAAAATAAERRNLFMALPRHCLNRVIRLGKGTKQVPFQLAHREKWGRQGQN
jgi:hypothetical protein